MNLNKWTIGLAAAGLISLPTIIQAEEKLSPLLTGLSSTTISGYVNVSAWWNPGTGNANSPAIPFSGGKQDGFNLDVAKLTLEKGFEEGSAWSAGYKVDLLFGPDANFYASQSSGFASDFGVKQAYVALRAPVGNGLDFKLGVWDTVIGYEGFDAGNNPNYTRSYGYAVEPTTHTGLLATYQVNGVLGVSAGVANTFGPRINAKAHAVNFPPSSPLPGDERAESYKTYMGSIALTAPESLGFLEGSTLYVGVINGFNSGGVDPNGGADQTSLYAGATIATPVTGLKVGVAYDAVFVSGQPVTQDEASYANVFGVYASYQLTEKLSVHARGEYATTDTALLGLADKVIEGTGTIQYDLWKNVLTRLEFRWDHSANGDDAFGGEVAGAPTRKNAYLVAANVIYKF